MVLRFITLAIYLIWIFWWYKSSPRQQKEEGVKRSGLYFLSKYANIILTTLIALQLLGLSILPIQHVFPLHDSVGFGIFLCGIGISIWARLNISTNWTPGYNYAYYTVRKSQTITKIGIYTYIRHPIYVGIFLAYVGAELIAQSYVSVVLLGLFVIMYIQAKKEEKLLSKRFGKEYKDYMKKTKMFIPFIL